MSQMDFNFDIGNLHEQIATMATETDVTDMVAEAVDPKNDRLADVAEDVASLCDRVAILETKPASSGAQVVPSKDVATLQCGVKGLGPAKRRATLLGMSECMVAATRLRKVTHGMATQFGAYKIQDVGDTYMEPGNLAM